MNCKQQSYDQPERRNFDQTRRPRYQRLHAYCTIRTINKFRRKSEGPSHGLEATCQHRRLRRSWQNCRDPTTAKRLYRRPSDYVNKNFGLKSIRVAGTNRRSRSQLSLGIYWPPFWRKEDSPSPLFPPSVVYSLGGKANVSFTQEVCFLYS